MSQFAVRELGWWRDTDVNLRHDQEHALGALTRLIRRDVDTARTKDLRHLQVINVLEPSREAIKK